MSVKIASLFAEISADTSKLNNSLKSSKGELSSFGSNMKSMAVTGMAVMAGLTATFYAFEKGIDATVGVFVDYAGQVRTISQVTGKSAESVSRLLQVTDDYKISADSLTVVMKKMATEGFSFTTDSLADLSDAYLKLNSGVERQIFLNEKFGKQGEAFAEIMLAGGDAIREKSGAVSDSLILTQKAIDEARKYELANDALSDAVMGLKVNLGMGLIPTLTGVVQGIVAVTSSSEWLIDLLKGDFTGAADAAAAALVSAGFEMEGFSEYTRDARDETSGLGAALDATTEEMIDYSAMANTIVSGAQMMDDQMGNLNDAYDEQAEALRIYTNYVKENPYDTEGAAELYANVVAAAGAIRDLKAANEEQTKAWVANIVLQQLSINGLSEPEMDWYLQYMVHSGLMSEESATTAGNMYNDAMKIAGGFDATTTAANNITSALESIPKVIDVKVNIQEQYNAWQQQEHEGATAGTFASGGAFSGWAMVGDSKGGGITPYTEWVYAPHGAVVYNQQQMGSRQAPPMAGGGVIGSDNQFTVEIRSLRNDIRTVIPQAIKDAIQMVV